MVSDRDMISRLKPGAKVRAKVVGVKGDLVKLELRGGEVVYGKSEIPLDFSNEKFMNFIIKEIGDNILSLVPDYDSVELDDNYAIKNEKLIMNKALELLGLEKNDENVELVKNMVKFKMPLDTESVNRNMKYMEKLNELLSIGTDEEVFVINKGVDEVMEDVSNIFKLPKENRDGHGTNVAEGLEELEFKEINYGREVAVKPNKTQVNIDETMNRTSESSGNVQSESREEGEVARLKNIIETLDKDIKAKLGGVTDGEEPSKLKLERADYKNVTEEMRSELGKLFPEGKLTDKDIQKLVFLSRSEAKVSIENLNNLNSLLKGEDVSSDVENLIEMAFGEKLISPEAREKLKSMAEQIRPGIKEGSPEEIKDYNRKLNELIEAVSERISDIKSSGEDVPKQIDRLNEKLDMYNKINDKSLFMFVPLSVERGEVREKLYFMSKRRHGKSSESIKAYISLETDNLNRVSVLCDYTYGRLDISFKVSEDKKALFLSTKGALESALSDSGYSDVNISVRDDMEEQVLDMISDSSSINYMINVKV